MKPKYKLIGLTQYAETYLDEKDFDELTEMIGDEVEESDNLSAVDGKRMFIMSDGEEVHIDYLELEEIQAELPFENLP